MADQTAQTADLMTYARSKMSDMQWESALKDIFCFIQFYVPKDLFDLDRAAPQQLELFTAVMKGKRYFVIRAPRKGGKTICVAIIAVWLTLRNQKYRVFILSGSQSQAEWLYDYCRKILWPGGAENAPRRDFFAHFLAGEPTKSRIIYKAGGWIRYTAASEKQVNAPTADGLINDEYVLIPSDIVQEAWPMIRGSEDPLRILLSTATPGKENTESFLSLLEDAEDLGFTKIEWEEQDCPFLQTKQAKADSRVARYILSDEMFRTQYVGSLPKGAGRIFPKTFLRTAFVALDKDKPGFLKDGTPYDPKNLEFRGESKGAFDWGFDHDTAMLCGYRGLNRKFVLLKCFIENNTSSTDWSNRAEEMDKKHKVHEWFCDAAGAFENRALEDRGLIVTRRPFQSKTEGKEWLIGVTYYWLQHQKVVIPDTQDFDLLKKQLLEYRRGGDGKPVKKFDNAVDSFLLWLSGWDPIFYGEEEETAPKAIRPEEPAPSAVSWETYKSGEEGWMPEEWRGRKEELTRLPWEKT